MHCDICARVKQTELALSSGEKTLNLLQNLESNELTANYEGRTLQLLGILYLNNKNYSQSVSCFQRLKTLIGTFDVCDVEKSFVVEKIVEGLLKQGKNLLAKPYIEELIEIKPRFENLLQYGKMLICLEEAEKAVKVLGQALNLLCGECEEKFNALVTLALAWIKVKDFRAAKKVLNDCIRVGELVGIENNAEVLWVYTQLGQIYFTEDEDELAFATLQTSKSISEDLQIFDLEYGNILLLLGKLKLRSNEKTDSLIFLNSSKRILENFGKDNSLECQLAILQVYLKDSNLQKTWEILQEIEKNQYSPLISALAQNEMGNLLREFGHLSQSLKYYEAAYEKYQVLKGPESQEAGKVLFNIASLLHKLGKFNQAIECFNKCSSIKLKYYSANSVELANIYVEVGDCLVKVGRKGYGREVMEKGLRIIKAADGLSKS